MPGPNPGHKNPTPVHPASAPECRKRRTGKYQLYMPPKAATISHLRRRPLAATKRRSGLKNCTTPWSN